jgi:hypothetical protein
MCNTVLSNAEVHDQWREFGEAIEQNPDGLRDMACFIAIKARDLPNAGRHNIMQSQLVQLDRKEGTERQSKKARLVVLAFKSAERDRDTVLAQAPTPA